MSISVIQQMQGGGSNRKTRWPADLYQFCAAMQFAHVDGKYGLACAYTGVWLSWSKDHTIGVKGCERDYPANLDHIDPASFTWDNTFLNLQFISKWINQESFKHAKITPHTKYIRARLGHKNDWPFVAELMRKTYDTEGILLAGWPLAWTSDADGSPLFPGYDETAKAFSSARDAIYEEYRLYMPHVKLFLKCCTDEVVSANVTRIWSEHFGGVLPLRSARMFAMGN